MIPQVFDLIQPIETTIPLVVDSPHSGVILPDDFHFACSLHDLRQSDEFYVDHFADHAVNAGATVLKARVSRAYIDLNRAVSDLHPSVCTEKIPWDLTASKRVQHGIGLIRHLIKPGVPVYDAPLPLAVIEARIRDYYDPYYAALQDTLRRLHDAFGRVLHVDLHGMPSVGAEGRPMPDIVLGDHDGRSCARGFREALKHVFERHGLKVMINDPYKGVELTRRFAKPRQGYHAIQIEVNKALFMDEESFAATDGLAEMQRVFADLWAELRGLLDDATQAKAAE